LGSWQFCNNLVGYRTQNRAYGFVSGVPDGPAEGFGQLSVRPARRFWETYRTSKAALNMGARSFANRHTKHPVLSIAPGWVRTDMGGPSATFDVKTSCRNVANAIAQHASKTGHRYVNYDGTELPW
jgi:NAD(P)-dependent dehydrogenase (short-subunit alcohol dehydrogenase family)